MEIMTKKTKKIMVNSNQNESSSLSEKKNQLGT